MSDDDEAKATDYLAKTVYQSGKMQRIGFVHFKSANLIKTKPKPKLKPVVTPKKPGKKR